MKNITTIQLPKGNDEDVVRFSQMTYKPVEIDQWANQFNQKIDQLKKSHSLEDKLVILGQINHFRDEFDSMHNICTIRYDLNTEDTYYDEQNEMFNRIMPRYEQCVDHLYQVLLEDSRADELESALGSHFFNLMRMKRGTFSSDIMQLLAEENQLSSEYVKLRSSIRIEYNGQSLNIPQMEPYLEVVNRQDRKSAHEALEAAFEKHADAFESLYDRLVQVRHQVATKLGYESFTPLGYLRLNRSDYGPNEVSIFREAILNHLVPALDSVYKIQGKRLGVDVLKYYDLSLVFTDGNPKPKGDAKWILEEGAKMYKAISEETHEFFQALLKGEWMDLEAKSGKAGGGYCTYIPNYRAPFIFSNFNGTMGDIDVLTHEAGHAYQVFRSRNQPIPEYLWPTLEACEIHSMSMEYLTYPYMENFFKEDTAKYYYAHMAASLRFLPYGVLVDHFQHWIYENPNVTHKDRRAMWRSLEKIYLPHKDYDENAFLDSGTYWFRQGHIFMDPFYYIDYTLASMCAIQFWKLSKEDPKEALKKYNDLCVLGGSEPFTALLKTVGLDSPFNEEAVKKALKQALDFVKLQETML